MDKLILHIKQTTFKILEFSKNILFPDFHLYSRIQSRITLCISQACLFGLWSVASAIFSFMPLKFLKNPGQLFVACITIWICWFLFFVFKLRLHIFCHIHYKGELMFFLLLCIHFSSWPFVLLLVRLHLSL